MGREGERKGGQKAHSKEQKARDKQAGGGGGGGGMRRGFLHLHSLVTQDLPLDSRAVGFNPKP